MTHCSPAGGALAIASHGRVSAQVPVADNNITPVYEGWVPNPDGSFELMFGYLNREWDEEISIPLVVRNTIDPGGPGSRTADQLFPAPQSLRVSCPRAERLRQGRGRLDPHEQGADGEGVRHAARRLRPGRYGDHVKPGRRRGAEHDAGHGRQQGAGAVGRRHPKTRTARVGEAIVLSATATDDGKPNKRNMPATLGGNYMLPQTANGLRLSFFVYRGTGKAVRFEPRQTKVWEDTRDGGGSPWSAGWIVPPIPEGNTWQARATFAEPGTYVIRALAHDGGLFSSQDVTVVVTRQ